MENIQSRLSQRSPTLIQHDRSGYRLILTDAPLRSNLPELWVGTQLRISQDFRLSVKSLDEWFNTSVANSGTGDKKKRYLSFEMSSCSSERSARVRSCLRTSKTTPNSKRQRGKVMSIGRTLYRQRRAWGLRHEAAEDEAGGGDTTCGQRGGEARSRYIR